VEAPLLWNDSYDMQQDVEYLCTNLSLDELNQLNEDFETAGLPLVHQLTLEHKAAAAAANAADSVATSSMTPPTNGTSNGKTNGSSNAVLPWSAQELSALAKAAKKYPAGLASRWDVIAQVVNTTCRPQIPRTREACIEKFNQMARIRGPTTTTTTTAAVDKPSVANTATNATASAATTMNGQHGDNGVGTRDSTDAETASKEPPLWTPEQDRQLQDALALYPASMEKNERWTAIAAAVPGQSKKSCVQRFKAIREALLQAKK
jgi:DnaJ homolog subfamily C member 2